jgi:isopenicillin-N epimerase
VTSLRQLFLLDPDVVFLNHGSFGACPRAVFEEYQRRQLELERQPVEFLARDRRFPALIEAAKVRLADYVGADPVNLVFVPNATSAVNVVARSLRLEPGDEVLASDQEYGALDYLWEHVCRRNGARYVKRPPASLPEALTERTRVLFVSHITSRTALRLPVEDLCRRARKAGALTIVDGAHAPGQIPLDLEALGADVYAGNCHKWLCAPKGAGFLFVRPEHQAQIEPLVVSWDWGEGQTFAERHRYEGTRDPAAYLAVPAAIDFQAEHDWDAVRERCRALAERARIEIASLTGIEPQPGQNLQMVSVPLPPCDPKSLQRRLHDDHRIEIPCALWAGRPLLRASFQGYNDESDLERLLAALRVLL